MRKRETDWAGVQIAMVAGLLAWLVAAGFGAEERRADAETDPLVLANLEKFQDMKFGLFIHWGPCSQWGARIAWPLSESQTWARQDDLPAWIERGKNFEVFCPRLLRI